MTISKNLLLANMPLKYAETDHVHRVRAMMKSWISLIAEYKREDQGSKIGDPLAGLTNHVFLKTLALSVDTVVTDESLPIFNASVGQDTGASAAL